MDQEKPKPSFPIENLGLIAASHAMPVVGCAEGQSVFPQWSLTIGCLLTAYDMATGPDRIPYSECKRLKAEGGFKCMAPVFPKVSVLRDYQYWTSALKDYIDQCIARDPSEASTHLVVQRCRGSEVAHTFEVWETLLTLGGFWDTFEPANGYIRQEFESRPDSLKDLCQDQGMTLSICRVYHCIKGQSGTFCSLLCTIYFREGWEPQRIQNLPEPCQSEDYRTTVFLLGTCCRFRNCDEGDVLIPYVSLRYEVSKRLLAKTPEVPRCCGDYFEVNKRRIWSRENQKTSAKIILYAIAQTGGSLICGDARTFKPAYDWDDIKSAIHIQLSDIFEAGDETSAFSVTTTLDEHGNPTKKQRNSKCFGTRIPV